MITSGALGDAIDVDPSGQRLCTAADMEAKRRCSNAGHWTDSILAVIFRSIICRQER